MKKSLLFFIGVILTISSLAQDGGQTTGAKSQSSLPNVCGVIFPPLKSDPTYGRYTDYLSTTTAQQMTSNYLSNKLAQIDNTVGYYTYDAYTFLGNIITLAGDNNIQNPPQGGANTKLQNIAFVIGYDNNIEETVLLVFGLDAATTVNPLTFGNSNVIELISDGSSISTPNNIEKLVSVSTLSVLPAATAGVRTIAPCQNITFPSLPNAAGCQNCLLISNATASNMIKAYHKKTSQPIIAFEFDAGRLTQYFVSQLAANYQLQDVAFVLSMDGTLRLLAMGIDPGGNPIYTKNNKVLEHCYPCPEDCPPTLSSQTNIEHILDAIH